MNLPNIEQSTPNKLVIRLAFLINIISLGGFMMVVPLGPDLVDSINFNPAHIGYLIGGTMFGSAAMTWLLAGHLDKYDRKSELLYFYFCVVFSWLLVVSLPHHLP